MKESRSILRIHPIFGIVAVPLVAAGVLIQQYRAESSNNRGATQPISMVSDPHSGVQHTAANAPDAIKQEAATRDSQVTTPRSLVDAARKADIARVRSLLTAGADPNEVDNSDIKGWTPLMEAVRVGSVDVAEALLEAHANVNATNAFSATPLDIAITNHGESSTLASLVRAAGGKRGAAAKALAVSRNSTLLTQAARDEQSAAHLARAKALWSSGNAKEALDECDAALKLDRTNAEASALRGKYARALDILNGTSQ
jgi:hypothetical protein